VKRKNVVGRAKLGKELVGPDDLTSASPDKIAYRGARVKESKLLIGLPDKKSVRRQAQRKRQLPKNMSDCFELRHDVSPRILSTSIAKACGRDEALRSLFIPLLLFSRIHLYASLSSFAAQ
jgi:hypothetical protein